MLCKSRQLISLTLVLEADGSNEQHETDFVMYCNVCVMYCNVCVMFDNMLIWPGVNQGNAVKVN